MHEMELGTPQEIDQTGIDSGLLEDLALKILYLNGEMSLLGIERANMSGARRDRGDFQILPQGTAL